ncbi:MAG: 50S ribosomal protein L18 [Ignavibacteria bacterium]|jgi:large subunit ribosomal protein L18
MTKKDKLRLDRKRIRIRKKISGTADRPRVSIFRSLNEIYAQVIDDVSGKTLCSASSKSKEIADEIKKAKGKIEKSKVVGKYLAKVAQEAGITKVSFDRGLYKYHGRVKALADAAREGGLKF